MAGHQREKHESGFNCVKLSLLEFPYYLSIKNPRVVIVGFVWLAMPADTDVMHGLISFAKITPAGNHPNHINCCWVTRLSC